jgi:hypothetical protein
MGERWSGRERRLNARRIFKVKQGLLTLAALSLAAAAAGPASALNTNSITVNDQGTVTLAQAYPCTVGSYPANLGISDLQTWCGSVSTPSTVGASPGFLCLARKGLALDVNCFAVIPPDQFPPCFVQAFRLIKQVPGSFKCPDVYGIPHFDDKGNLLPYTYFQYGSGVRTWWSLNFTQPGTKFILEVVSVCRSTNGATGVVGSAVVHTDRWTWRVTATVETLAQLIEVMHGGAVSTLEIPCILAEDMYDALVKARGNLATAVAGGDRTAIGNAIFDMEALIVSNCVFAEVLNPIEAFPGPAQFGQPNFQPPGNLAQRVVIGQVATGMAGIIDTIENPCCCKLLVDLEFIAIKNGIIGQTPTLPVF